MTPQTKTKKTLTVAALLTIFFLSMTAAPVMAASVDHGSYEIKGRDGSDQMINKVDKGKIEKVYGTEDARKKLNEKLFAFASAHNIKITFEQIKTQSYLVFKGLSRYKEAGKNKKLGIIYSDR